MEEKKIRLALDRVESDIAICLDDDEVSYPFPVERVAGIKTGDVFLGLIRSDGTVEVLDRLENENAERHARNKRRLDRLFGRS